MDELNKANLANLSELSITLLGTSTKTTKRTHHKSEQKPTTIVEESSTYIDLEVSKTDNGKDADKEEVEVEGRTKRPFHELEGSHLDVPMDSIYMTAIISPLAADSKLYQCSGNSLCFPTWWNPIWHYFLLSLNIVIQLSFIYFAGHVVLDHKKDDSCHDNQILLFICYILFTVGINKDVRETLFMSLWLNEFPTSDAMEELEYVENEYGEKELISGMPRWYKQFVFVFVLLPKLGVAFLLWLVGGVYLARSDSSETLILNCVALFFIYEIDEMIWKNLIPTEHQMIGTEFPSIKSPLTRVKWVLVLYTFVNGVVTFVLNLTYTGVLYGFSCHSEFFHDYSNDTTPDLLF